VPKAISFRRHLPIGADTSLGLGRYYTVGPNSIIVKNVDLEALAQELRVLTP